MMLSILGKLLCTELGEQRYNIYFDSYSGAKKQNEVIFCDIYKQLRSKDIDTLQSMLERLLSAIELSMKISRQYMWVWIATILTVILLIILPVPVMCMVTGIFIVVTSFGYKSIVFLINRYCFIDANIVLIYKTALYHLILTYNIRKMNMIT